MYGHVACCYTYLVFDGGDGQDDVLHLAQLPQQPVWQWKGMGREARGSGIGRKEVGKGKAYVRHC